MIDDSYVWKDRLRRGRVSLRRKMREAQHDPDRLVAAFVEVEAFVFLAAYIIRKLIEARKLSDELEAAIMEVVAYPARPDYALDFLNADRIDQGYDLASPTQKSLVPKRLCDLLVHSFVFMPATDEEGTTCIGFFLNSDRTKKKELLFVVWEDFDLLVGEVVRDYVVTMSVDRICERVTKSRVGDGEEAPTIFLNVKQSHSQY